MHSVILAGPRGSVKTSVGLVLSANSGVPFVDGNAEFVKRYGTINDFVASNGWEKFRQLEAETLEQICETNSRSRIILAVGGGAVAHKQGEQYRQKNVELLRSNGNSVFYILPYENLGMSAVMLVNRIERDSSSASQRPALTGVSDPYLEMLSVLQQRDALYREAAHYVVYTTRKSPEQIARDICAIIRRETAPKLLAPAA